MLRRQREELGRRVRPEAGDQAVPCGQKRHDRQEVRPQHPAPRERPDERCGNPDEQRHRQDRRAPDQEVALGVLEDPYPSPLANRVGEDPTGLGLPEVVKRREHRPEAVEIARDVGCLDGCVNDRDRSVPFARGALERLQVRVLVGEDDAHLDAVVSGDFAGHGERRLARARAEVNDRSRSAGLHGGPELAGDGVVRPEALREVRHDVGEEVAPRHRKPAQLVELHQVKASHRLRRV